MRTGKGTGERAFQILNYTGLVVLMFATLYPFVWVLSASVSDPAAVARGEVVLLPKGFSLDAYRRILEYTYFWKAYGNTVFYVITATALNVFLTMLLAYPMSRTWFYGRGLFTFIIVFTMFFGGGLIPSYLLVRGLKLVDRRGVMIILGAVSAWNFVLARSYLQANIPDELIEAAQIDGANDFYILFRVVMPLSQPIIAVLTLFYAVSHWNDYFTPLIYLRNKDLMPVQVVLRDIVVMVRMQEMMVDVSALRANLTQVIKYSTIVVATVPILLVYPFLQRYFVKGVMLGALKG